MYRYGPRLVGGQALSRFIGIRERRSLGKRSIQTNTLGAVIEKDAESYLPAINAVNDEPRRSRMLWFNAALTLALMSSLVMELLPLSVLFMVAFAIALLINYRHLDAQRQRIAAQALPP
ncbi:hypothetical protein [Klebsiella quasipneumoniae]|uniref:hypothetical protein n=1 Tax=Klebsiella quasipneumoniae TaxID=1463165 RepID=UPI002D80A7A7|nr:hypothetical protein [Klebsiella quasipneumoniae]MEB4699632.1 hypothetical protein [Klebsiella quasipneumoniae]